MAATQAAQEPINYPPTRSMSAGETKKRPPAEAEGRKMPEFRLPSRHSRGGTLPMRDWFKSWREARQAKVEGRRAAVAAEADRLMAECGGDARNAFWAAKHELEALKHGSRRWSLVYDAGQEIDRRIGRRRRPGPDTATRMLYGD